MRRPTIILILIAIVVAVLAWLLTSPPLGDAPKSPPLAGQEAAVGSDPEVAPVAEASAEHAKNDRVLSGWALRVIDAVSKEALPGATLTLLHDSLADSVLTQPPDHLADERGAFVLPKDVATGRILLFRAPSHVPRAFAAERPTADVVELAPCAALEVRCIDANSRAVDVTAALSLDVSAGFLSNLGGSRPGIGHPLAQRPRWVANADALGIVRFDELPPARYYLDVVAGEHFPLDDVACHGSLDLLVGPRVVTVTLEQAHAVVFRVPSSSPVANLNWDAPTMDLDRSRAVIARRGAILQAVEKRFPGCLVYAHRPATASKPIEVACRVHLQDATLWQGRWALTPLAAITEPVFLEQVLVPTRATAIRVRDPIGDLSNIPLFLRPTGGESGLDVVSGVSAALPYGEYEVTCGLHEPAFFAAFRGVKVRIHDTSDPEFVVTLPSSFSEVLINVRYPKPDVIGPLTISLGEDAKFRSVVANYVPERGPIRRFVAGRRVAVQVRSVGYEDVDVEQDVDRSRVTVVEISLREKATNQQPTTGPSNK